MLYSDHLIEYEMLFGLKIKPQNTRKRHFPVRGRSILTEKNLKYTEKDATAIRKHYHNHVHTTDTACFSLVGNASNKYHLKLKESLLILKMKPSFNVAKESISLHLFENDL